MMRKLPMRYHHLGIPTKEPREGEYFLPDLRMHICGYRNNPYGIEWLRFEADSPIPDLVKDVPHLAFQVEDLDVALEGHEVLISPNSPSEGVRVAFIVHDGVPVEFLEFSGEHPDRLPGSGERKGPDRD